MKHFAKLIAYHPKLIVIVALILLIPSAIGYVNTFVNYDILSYLPGDLDSVKGENILDQTFKSASTSFLIIDTQMPAKDITEIKQKISAIKGVSSVTWVDDIADISIPQEALPQAVKDIFYSKNGQYTLMLVQYEYSAVDTVTMDAVNSIRDVMNKQCFLSGMGVIVKDTKELADSQAPIYIAIAIALSLVVMTFCMESWLEPWVLLAALSIAVVYNMGTNVFFGQISYITQCIAAILQLGVTMDYSVFLIDRFEEEKKRFPDKRDAMASAIQGSFISLSGSSLTTIFGFLALCFMRLTLGRDIGLVMAKGVLFGVLTVTIILPALVIQLDKQLHRFRHRSFIPKFNKINAFTIKHKGIFVSVFLILLAPSFIMQNNVSLYYSMDKMLPPELPCVDALNKLKNEFNMATSHFIIVDDSIEDSRLVMMETEINELDGITNSIAYNSFVGSGIPDSMIPDSLKKLAKAGGKQMLLVNSSYEAATDECNAQLNAINDSQEVRPGRQGHRRRSALHGSADGRRARSEDNQHPFHRVHLPAHSHNIQISLDPRHTRALDRACDIHQQSRSVRDRLNDILHIAHSHRLRPARSHGRLRNTDEHKIQGGNKEGKIPKRGCYRRCERVRPLHLPERDGILRRDLRRVHYLRHQHSQRDLPDARPRLADKRVRDNLYAAAHPICA